MANVAMATTARENMATATMRKALHTCTVTMITHGIATPKT
jgi:hypothetical protein